MSLCLRALINAVSMSVYMNDGIIAVNAYLGVLKFRSNWFYKEPVKIFLISDATCSLNFRSANPHADDQVAGRLRRS